MVNFYDDKIEIISGVYSFKQLYNMAVENSANIITANHNQYVIDGDVEAGDYYGYGVAVSDTRIVVGAKN